VIVGSSPKLRRYFVEYSFGAVEFMCVYHADDEIPQPRSSTNLRLNFHDLRLLRTKHVQNALKITRFGLTMADPLFHVPPGTETVQVRIIDTTTRLGKVPLDFLMQPPMAGMQYMPEMPAWSFLIEHCSGQNLLFDLAAPKDLGSFSPFILAILDKMGSDVTVEHDVIDILKNNGIGADQISGIIWRSDPTQGRNS
jgi:hypothetical protein